MKTKRFWGLALLIVLVPFLERSPLTAVLPAFLNFQLSLLVLVFFAQKRSPWAYPALAYLALVPDLLVSPRLGAYLFSYLLAWIFIEWLVGRLGAPSLASSFIMTLAGGLVANLSRYLVLGGMGLPLGFLISSLIGTGVLASLLHPLLGEDLPYQDLREDQDEEELLRQTQ